MDMRVAAYAVITDDEGRILLAHWNEGRRAAWTLPGGGLEPGEDPEVAARREVREETGYKVEVGELLGIHSRVIPASRRVHEGRDRAAARPAHRLPRADHRRQAAQRDRRLDRSGGVVPARQVAELQRVKLVDIALKMAGILLVAVVLRDVGDRRAVGGDRDRRRRRTGCSRGRPHPSRSAARRSARPRRPASRSCCRSARSCRARTPSPRGRARGRAAAACSRRRPRAASATRSRGHPGRARRGTCRRCA